MHRNIILPMAGFLLWGFGIGCQSKPSEKMDQFKLVISDELDPAGLLPEYIEVDHTGKLVILTNRFNTDGTKYHHQFFVDASASQTDSLLNMVYSLEKNKQIHMSTNPSDTVIYKVCLSGIKDMQRISYMWVGSQFSPELTSLIAYCQLLPEKHHRYKLNEPHYFSTTTICVSKP